MSASNGGDDQVAACKDTRGKRAKRGKICLTSLAKRRVKGILVEVKFNKLGQLVEDFGAEIQSYIGLITCKHVNINIKSWTKVSEEVKKLIWESVNVSVFDMSVHLFFYFLYKLLN